MVSGPSSIMHPLFYPCQSSTGPGVRGQVPRLLCRGFFCRLPASTCCELECVVTAWIKGLRGEGGGFPAGLLGEIPVYVESAGPCPRASPGGQVLPQGSLLRDVALGMGFARPNPPTSSSPQRGKA